MTNKAVERNIKELEESTLNYEQDFTWGISETCRDFWSNAKQEIGSMLSAVWNFISGSIKAIEKNFTSNSRENILEQKQSSEHLQPAIPALKNDLRGGCYNFHEANIYYSSFAIID